MNDGLMNGTLTIPFPIKLAKKVDLAAHMAGHQAFIPFRIHAGGKTMQEEQWV